MSSLNPEYFFKIIYDCISGQCVNVQLPNLLQLWLYARIFLIVACVILFILVVRVFMQQYKVNKKFESMIGLPPKVRLSGKKNERWERIVTRSKSSNPADWRVAIIECDLIVDEMLSTMGYVGDTLTDKLNMVNPSESENLPAVREAHQIRETLSRNQPDVEITHEQALHAISLYEKFFREFDFI